MGADEGPDAGAVAGAGGGADGQRAEGGLPVADLAVENAARADEAGDELGGGVVVDLLGGADLLDLAFVEVLRCAIAGCLFRWR